MQQEEQQINRKDETPQIILNKIEHILEKSPNSIRNFFRKRKIDVASISLNKNPLIKAIEEEQPLPKIHALMKNFSSIQKKKHINKTDIEMIKMELELNKKFISILENNDIELIKHFIEKESFNLNFFKNENNPLMYAIRNGKSFNIIKLLLQHNININFHELTGSCPLTEAVIVNNKDVFNLLLKKGANINHVNYFNETPLLYLIKNGIMNRYYLYKFIENNANIDLQDNSNNSILMYLTKNNDSILVDFLLDQLIFDNNLIVNLITLGKNRIGISTIELSQLIKKGYSKVTIDTLDNMSNTPLMYACQEGCYNIVSTLITYNADINKDNIGNNRPLFFACYNNNFDICELLLNTKRVEINHKNKRGDTELTLACLNDNPELIELLVKYNTNVNCVNDRGHYPVHIATINDKLETLKALLAHGADIYAENIIGNQCFSLACINENFRIIEYLLTLSVDYNHTNYSGDSALHQCFILQKKDVVKRILQLENINIDIPNCYGFTPFLIACKKNDYELAKLLLEQGKPINIDAQTNGGDFPLFFAVYHRNIELIKLLFNYKVNIYAERSAKSYVCYTAFLLACGDYGNEELIQLFIDNGIDVNRPNSMNVFPLYEACKSEKIEHVELLLKNGAIPNLDPLCIIQACADNDMRMVDLLIKFGADVNIETKEGMNSLVQLVTMVDKRNCKMIQYLIGKGANLYCKDNYGNSLLYIVKNSNKIDKEEVYDTLIAAYKDRNDYHNKCADTKAFIETYDIYKRVMGELESLSALDPNVEFDAKSLQNKFTQEELDRTYLQATIFGKEDEVKRLFEIFPNINVNVRETNGDTPLIIACQTGRPEIAKFILEHGADPNPICECGSTALYVATFSYGRHQSLELMESLLKHGANLNVICQYSLSPLMVACKDNLEEVTQLFLQYNADPNMQDSDGNTALAMACNRNSLSIVEILLKSKDIDINKPTKKGYTPLMIACNNKYLHIAKVLIEAGADIYPVNDYQQNALNLSSLCNCVDIYDTFFECSNKMDLLREDLHGLSFYNVIKLNGNVKYLNTAIKYEIDYLETVLRCYECTRKDDLPANAINYIGKEAYDDFDTTIPGHEEIHSSYIDKLNYMKEEQNNYELYQKLKTKYQEEHLNLNELSSKELSILLIYSVIYLDIKIFYYIYNHMEKSPNLPLDINATDQDGNTALHYACSSENYKRDFLINITRILLKHPNIQKNKQNNKGFTPVMLTCFKNNGDLGQILIKDKDVDPNIPTYKNETPLMAACFDRSFTLVNLLFDYHQIDANIQESNFGNTALAICSIFYYSYNIIRVLIEKGKADVNICNFKNESPLIQSCYSNRIEHIKMLIDHGADVNVQEKEEGLTPLMIVLSNFNYYIGKYLCEHQADINLCNNKGETALIVASLLYNKYGSELLIEKHADISMKNHKGQTAKSIIEKNDFNFVIGL